MHSTCSPIGWLLAFEGEGSSVAILIEFAIDSANAKSDPVHIEIPSKPLDGPEFPIKGDCALSEILDPLPLIVSIFDAKTRRNRDRRRTLVAHDEAASFERHLDLAKRLLVAGARNLERSDVRLHDDFTGLLRSLSDAWSNAQHSQAAKTKHL